MEVCSKLRLLLEGAEEKYRAALKLSTTYWQAYTSWAVVCIEKFVLHYLAWRNGMQQSTLTMASPCAVLIGWNTM
jgi:hypothetical protein